MEDYKLILWPEIQDYMELDGFEENSEMSLKNDGACYVSVEWLKKVKP